MKILFIGGTGNISSDAAALLRERGHEIVVVSRGQMPVPAEYRAIQGNRKDLAGMRTALAGVRPDVVINFLGYERGDLEVDFALFNGVVQQYVFISSASVYEKPPRRLPITEETPLGNPYWDYAQKKLECERWLQQQQREHGFPVTIVRPSHTYSCRWIPNPLSSGSYTFAARLEEGRPVYVADDGQTPWTLTAASDFAVGLAGLVGLPAAIGETFHITSDEVLTWNQIVDEIAAALGVKSPQVVRIPTEFICRIAPQMKGTLQGDKSHPGVFDNAKLKRLVPEFRTRKPFQVGVRESVAWLRAHPEHQNRRPDLEALADRLISEWQKQPA
jgi:nucleoside-diphosphate-sugar epimerase